MKIEALLPEQVRILDVGAPDELLGTTLAALGFGRYLGLMEPARFRAQGGHPALLGGRLQPLDDPAVVTRSSADLLLLRRGYERLVWGWPQLAHFSHIAIEEDRLGWETRVALRLATARGRLRPCGRLVVDGLAGFDFYRVETIRERRPRTYFSPVWGVGGLAQRLAEENLDYAVLRWFEQLPVMEPGEDLDILVRDTDVEPFRALVESEPGTIPIDLYSVTGIDGTDFRGAAYYVPDLATQILTRAVTHQSGVRVPSPEDHMFSLTYHALYHKGAASGLPTALALRDPADSPEHDYGEAIARAAQECGATLPADMEGLDDRLAIEGWRPPLDALRRLAIDNAWLRERIGRQRSSSLTSPEFAVFLLRERAVEHIAMEQITARLEHLGFEIISIDDLDESTRERATASIRGGNWGKGPYAVSGGRPARIIVCIHYAPWPIDDALRHRYPHLTNADTLNAKLAVRAMIEDALGPEAAFNAMHSADDEHEAWEYLRIVLPGAVDRIRHEYADRIHRQSAPHGTNQTLSRGRRARVDVLNHGETRVVRKTYTQGGGRHLEREIDALEALSVRISTVPPLLDRGDNWFEIEYFDDRLAALGDGLLPLRVVRRMVSALREIHDLGFDLIDAKPDNFIWDSSDGLRVVDLEFAYPARELDRSFAEGPVFHSPDAAFYEDLPVGDSTYDVRWRPWTGMPVHVLVEAGPLVQHAHRVVHRLRELTVAPGSPSRSSARRVKNQLRQVSSDARGVLFTWALAATRGGRNKSWSVNPASKR